MSAPIVSPLRLRAYRLKRSTIRTVAATEDRAKRRWRQLEGRIGREPTFVVVGTGRCGTNFVASTLAGAGVPCGHEELFTTDGPRRAVPSRGDVSWLAAPYLDGLDVPTFHLVREPLAVINSFLAIGFFRFDPARGFGEDGHAPYRRFAARWFDFTGDERHDAVNWYLTWNTLSERATDGRLHIEQPEQAVLRIVERVSPEKLDFVTDFLRVPPPATNTMTELKQQIANPTSLTRDGLLDLPRGDEVVAMASRYGYQL